MNAIPERLPLQYDDRAPGYWRRQMPNIPTILGRAAWQGYDADGHGSQSVERLHQRGGFGLGELSYFVARALDEGRIEITLTERSRPDSFQERDPE